MYSMVVNRLYEVRIEVIYQRQERLPPSEVALSLSGDLRCTTSLSHKIGISASSPHDRCETVSLRSKTRIVVTTNPKTPHQAVSGGEKQNHLQARDFASDILRNTATLHAGDTDRVLIESIEAPA